MIEKNAHMHGLTALRFFAALWVVGLHYRDNLPFDVDPYTSFFANGVMGVDLFFILSGFVLAHSYGRDLQNFNYVKFLTRRLARIYPMHLVTLVAMVALGLATSAIDVGLSNPLMFDYSQIPSQLLLLHAWNGPSYFAFNAPSWSISAEWMAYLVFPVIAVIFMKLPRFVGLFAAILMLCTAWVIAPYVNSDGLSLTRLQDASALRILPEFTLGMALYRVRPHSPLLWALALSIMLTVVTLHLGGPRFIAFWGLAGAVWSVSGFSAPMSLRLLGEASYSLYMIHGPLQIVVFNSAEFLGLNGNASLMIALVLLTTSIAIIGSILTFRFIEIPSRDYLNVKFDAFFARRPPGR